ncbi:MAG TPA: nitrate/nitrite transporter [Burkholderiales bacterium]|jgi:NNP family nitrate/nitrite transporter-like MFS transporter|nr:nitrate/nitrite transporter [Burkholderiales bacterium]
MQKSDSISVLIASTFAFIICFAVWMMFGVIGIPVRDMLGLNATEFGLLTATPVLTGAVFRLPLGIWTDRFGGRVVFIALLLGCAIPVWLVSFASAYWQFLVLGLFLGLVGASFAVGTPYVARFFAKQQQGFAMGVFGAGTSGAALNMFVAPWIIDHYGWRTVPTVYAVAILVTAVIFWLLSRPDPGVGRRAAVPLKAQFAVLRSPRVWRYCQYYSIVFGGFTALSLWMTQYYTQEYDFGIAQAALLAAAFSLPAGVMRAAGGWLADRLGAHSVTWWVLWVSWVCLFLLSYPQTDLTIHTVNGPVGFHIGLQPWLFTILLFVVGVAFAFGGASTFKYVAADFPEEMGLVTGIVGLAGGLAGFLLPILFGALVDLTRVRSSCFMLLYGVAWVSLILMYVTEVRRTPILGDIARNAPQRQ